MRFMTARSTPPGFSPQLLAGFFFFNDTATTEIYTLSLHDALPICLDDVAFLDRDPPGDLDLVDPGAVAAAEVLDQPGVAFAHQGEVLARDAGVLDRHVGLRRPADHHAVLGEVGLAEAVGVLDADGD